MPVLLDRTIQRLVSEGIKQSVTNMLTRSTRKKYVIVCVSDVDDEKDNDALDTDDIVSAFGSQENFTSMKLTSLSIDFDLLLNAVFNVDIPGINTAILRNTNNRDYCFIYYYSIEDVDFMDYDIALYSDIYKANDEFEERFQKKSILYTINRYNELKARLISGKNHVKQLEEEFEEFTKRLSPEELLAIEASK